MAPGSETEARLTGVGGKIGHMEPPILNRFRQRARALDKTVVLPEATDPRVLAAAAQARELGICRPLLVGERDAIVDTARRERIKIDPEQVRDPREDERRQELLDMLGTSRSIPKNSIEQRFLDPLYYANLLVKIGDADGGVMGAVATTGETLRAGLRVLGMDPRYKVVTSCFLMAWPDDRVLVYADCGVVPKPTALQLADIAMQAAETRRSLVGDEPRVALLAFSTLGSAQHESLDVVREAVRILAERKVDFPFDGELQGDAALVPEIAARKAPGSAVAGTANVMIFPDLNSGNIAYKLTERLAGARAIGPLLQGLAFPIHDLSRGCSVSDILDTLAITALDARR